MTSVVRLAILATLSCGLGPVAARAQTTQVHPSAEAAPKTAATTSGGYVGSETCALCHADVAKKFDENPHSKLALEHGGKGATCESCHGPGQAHTEDPADPKKIFRFDKATPKQIDATCLGCHAGAHPNFERSPHAKAGVSCTSCHSVHSFKSEISLLKDAQPKLCYACHADVKPAFALPFHHKVDEGLVKCSDCHDVHGTFNDKQLRTTADQNAICTKCHIENAGPFAYEHPVVKTEGCLACHSPHGSPNARLLITSNINTLCLQCHSGTNSTAFPNAVSPLGPAHNQSTQYVSCTSCHTQIHGSNASNVYFK
jgi:DmsE family decaheme c-type cytochrome